jgi:hypothetical protein
VYHFTILFSPVDLPLSTFPPSRLPPPTKALAYYRVVGEEDSDSDEELVHLAAQAAAPKPTEYVLKTIHHSPMLDREEGGRDPPLWRVIHVGRCGIGGM